MLNFLIDLFAVFLIITHSPSEQKPHQICALSPALGTYQVLQNYLLSWAQSSAVYYLPNVSKAWAGLLTLSIYNHRLLNEQVKENRHQKEFARFEKGIRPFFALREGQHERKRMPHTPQTLHNT